MTKCKTCGMKEGEVEFYTSIKTYCKDHWKQQVKLNRASKAEYYKTFDRNRANLPHRVASRDEYRKTLAYAISHNAANRAYKSRHPERQDARNAVCKAVRDGVIEKLPCLVCGASAEAHHPDYSLPLDVVWLCDEHHKQVHKQQRELEREAA